IFINSIPVNIKDGLTLELPQVFEDKINEEPIPVHTPEINIYETDDNIKSKLFSKFSYTGNGKIMLRTNLYWGKKAYVDLEFNYTVIPSYLNGSEYIRMPDSDKRYWARDQLQFIAGVDMDIYIGHDDRVPLPDFIKADYKDTGDNIDLGGVIMSLYKRTAKAGETIIMSGNSDGQTPKECQMYVVIGKKI
ncbi:MAG TPA: hypothetical protein DCS17_00525, partial [Flavobacterium sp.]|nr:hypothetical protein [Flavobacterium sp.]